MESSREENVFEIVADYGIENAFAAGAGTETLARKDVFSDAPFVGVAERGGEWGSEASVDRCHEDWGFRVWWQGQRTGA